LKRDIVLFDLGSTLMYFDSKWDQVLPECNTALLRSLQEAGLQVKNQDLYQQIGERMQIYDQDPRLLEYSTGYILQEIFAEQGIPEIPEDVLKKALRAMYAVSQAHWQAELDGEPTLQTLSSQGYHLGMISNAGDDTDVQTLVDKLGIRPFFDVILTSAAQGIRKPNPRLFYQALQRWEAVPEQAVMVGDTLDADILGAQNASIFGIWITRRANLAASQKHLETIHPDATIAELSELPHLLATLN
jgi:HAD superfamily hydrolase (TIGR01549 family)